MIKKLAATWRFSCLLAAISISCVATAARASTITIDNLDPGFTVQNGIWGIAADGSAFNGTYRYRAPGIGTGVVRFTPTILDAGSYEVSMYWVAGTNRATDAPFTITYDAGSQTVAVNQRLNGGVFNVLGTFNFLAGTGGFVELSDLATNGYVLADAVRFTSVSTTPLPTALPLFATGMAGLGWLARRRKSKVVVIVA